MAAANASPFSCDELCRTLKSHRAELGDLFQEWGRELSRLSEDQLLRQERLVEKLGLAQLGAADVAEEARHGPSCQSSPSSQARATSPPRSKQDKPTETTGEVGVPGVVASDAAGQAVSLSAWLEPGQPDKDPDTEVTRRVSWKDRVNEDAEANASSSRKQCMSAAIRKASNNAPCRTNTEQRLSRENSTASTLSGASKNGHMLRYVMQHAYFRAFISAAILLNAICMGIHAQWELNALIETGHGTDPLVWEVLEQAFCLFFIVELALRLISEGKKFWSWRSEEAPWNLFDTVLVTFSVFDLISTWMSTDTKAFNFNFARTLRILRFARILRIIRVMRFFHSFRLMVYSILYSMVSLMWVFLLLLFIMYSFSAFFLHGVTEFFRGLGDNPSDHDQKLATTLKGAFGSAPTACRSLFMGISGGRDWIELMEPLAEVGWFYGLVFVLYVFFMIFGVLNVVIGIFVDCSNDISQKNREIVTKNEMDKNKSYAEHLRRFFHEADTDHTGTLSWEEFEAYLKDLHVQAYFQSFELDVSQARTLFQLLDLDGSNDVEIDEFVQGCMRLKGQARSIDVNMLLYESEKILNKQTGFMDYMEERFDSLEKMRREDISKVNASMLQSPKQAPLNPSIPE